MSCRLLLGYRPLILSLRICVYICAWFMCLFYKMFYFDFMLCFCVINDDVCEGHNVNWISTAYICCNSTAWPPSKWNILSCHIIVKIYDLTGRCEHYWQRQLDTHIRFQNAFNSSSSKGLRPQNSARSGLKPKVKTIFFNIRPRAQLSSRRRVNRVGQKCKPQTLLQIFWRLGYCGREIIQKIGQYLM